METVAGAGDGIDMEKVVRVLEIVSLRLPQRDVYALLLVNPSCYRALVAVPSLWQVIDLHEMTRAGERLISALSLARYQHVKRINLEFSRDFEDEHFVNLKSKAKGMLQNLDCLNLNGCQKISDKGIEVITSCCPNLKTLSLYWNIRLSDLGIKHIIRNCKHVISINLSGCKNISDQTLHLISRNYEELEELNITSLTDVAYEKIACLAHLTFLDLCGAQNLSDQGLSCIARCSNLVSLNLTWCVRVTDVGVSAIAEGCRSLELLSLYGIVGVTDRCLEILSKFCSKTLTTLDVNGCIGIKKRSRNELLQQFPQLKCFKVHS